MGFVQTWMDLSNVDAMKVSWYIFQKFQIPKSEFSLYFLGYKLSLSGLSCVDIDDCRENPLICLHGRCRNTVGSYICECESGYLHSSDGGKFSLHLAEIKNYWLFSESLIYWIQKCTLWFDEKNRALINFRLQLFARTGSWVMRQPQQDKVQLACISRAVIFIHLIWF